MPRHRPLLFLSLALPLSACGNTTGSTPTTDAAGVTDAPSADVAPDTGVYPGCEGERMLEVSLFPPRIYLPPGSRATVQVRTSRDRCSPVTVPISATGSSATVSPASVSFAPGQSTATIEVTATAVGEATLRAGEATATVIVTAADLPACPTSTPAVTGRLSAGSTVRGAAGSPLAQASVGFPMVARDLPSTEVSFGCAADQIPDGYTAVGPAVRFDPGPTRLAREVPFTLPVNPVRVPTGYEMQVEVAYSSAGYRRPRVVPVADLHLTTDGRALTFRSPRFGTYQPVVRMGLGTRRVRRRFTFHSILGVSMGAAGAGMIGLRHPERFDFVAPLGGPSEWNYLLNYVHRYHLGGFCTAAQRAMNPSACNQATTERTPPTDELYEFRQNFEDWFYPDGWQGQGGNFDRRSDIQIFRDLTRMFGNAMVAPGSTGVLPRGVPNGELMRGDGARCSEPVRLGGAMAPMNERHYDREYNPDGALPVITFCDGTHVSGHMGRWDGGPGNFPMEVSLAVDVNNNGRRDAGEPVLRQRQERFQDTGTDGVPSRMEPGYDAMTNPDPAGDDYDRQFNPGGTENNTVHEDREPYEDLGLDGVACPAGRTCPYDLGEGNGRWDAAPGSLRFNEVNPRTLAANMSETALSRVEVWADGGVRDLFGFGPVGNHFIGAFAQRGRNVHYYNTFSALGAERLADNPFTYDLVDYARLPGFVMLRYGDVDASNSELINGDGGHVGTIPQITNRLYTSLYFMSSRWPGGDRTQQRYSTEFDNAGRCANGYFCTFDFRSEGANRTGPVSVYLPPGYHEPENANVRYPVLFLLHGYGQTPEDLVASGFIVGNLMSSQALPAWRRPQKFIMVFPDGRCRPQDNCLRGTFYADSPVGNAQMERYFLDLSDMIDRNYRVRAPEEVEVVQ